ncbi:MAG: hypothetical protein AAGF84_05990 [Planctomycetota bacterium]
MPDARDITQRIAGWLRSGAIPGDSQGAATADAYAVMIRRAAERLNRCAGLLAQGLRTEAVQEADAEPELLAQIAALELPDASAWGELCRRQGWAVPEVLRTDVAALLNRAYADEDLVEPLLREYRLRCVVRAPIRARLAALRALAGVDRANRPWHDALVDLEQARHQEIRREIDENHGDVDALLELRRELSDDRQKVRPPTDLVRRVDEALQDGRVLRAQRRLEALLPTLEDAYSAMDFIACQRLLDDWSQTLKAVGRSALHVPEPLRQRIEPILLWTQRQAEAQAEDLRFREACDRLADVTRQPGTADSLQAALDEASSYERPLPGTLGEDARDALDLRRRTQRRRRNLKLGGALAAAVTLAGLVGVWGAQQAKQRDLVNQSALVTQAADADDLATAEARFASLSESHAAHLDSPEATAASEALNAARQREHDRLEAFDDLIVSLKDSPVEIWKSESIKEAETLARSEQERASTAELRTRFDAHRKQDADAANAQALDAVVELRASLNVWDGAAIDADPLSAKQAGQTIASEAGQLAADERLRTSTAALLSALIQRADRVIEASNGVLRRERAAEAQATAKQALVAVADQPEDLASALMLFAERFPEAREAPAFAAAAAAGDAWVATEAWLALSKDWAGPPRSRVEAAERLRAIEAHRVAHPGSPWRGAIDRYAAYWGGALLASAEDGPWEKRLPELMRAPAFRDLGMAETNDGRRFYVVGDGNRRETSLGTSINVALTPDLTRLTPMDFPAGVLGPIALSPQASLANRLLSQLGAFEISRWDTFVVEVVATIDGAEDVDSVLRGLLLGLILDAYEAAVGALPSELAELRSRLELHADDAANWMDPGDLAAQRSRDALTELFAEPIDFEAVRNALDQRRAALIEAIRPEVVGHALLLRDEDGQRRMMMRGSDVGEPATLFAVVQDSQDVSAWRSVGRVDQDGTVTWDAAASLLSEGSPLWRVAEYDRNQTPVIATEGRP